VGSAHPGEGVFDGLAPLAHLFRMFVEPLLHRFENMLMLPSGDTPLQAGCAALFDGAVPAGIGPVAAQAQAAFFSCEAVSKPFISRTDIQI
jgi:hypothetical protein